MPTIKGMRGGLLGKKPEALSPTEATVSKAIQQFLDAHRIYNDRLNSGQFERVTRYTTKSGHEKEYRRWIVLCKKGTPDRFFILSGRIYFVEVKKWRGTLSAEQEERHKELRRAGAVVIVADSIDSFIEQFHTIVADRQTNTDTQKGDRKYGKKWAQSS